MSSTKRQSREYLKFYRIFYFQYTQALYLIVNFDAPRDESA